jgi:1-phosphofructokinase family hexose kinase
MLLVVSPNLAVDRILEVDGFRPAAVQRSRAVRSQPGGKGSNVARVFRQLGGEVALVGFVGKRNASWVVDPLRSIGVTVDAVEGYSGECRTCTVILDNSSRGHPTVVNEESPAIEPGAEVALLAAVERRLDRATALLVTGSLSRGLAADFYNRVLSMAAAHSCLTAIDATGDALRKGLQARPAMLKVNADEMNSALGDQGSDARQIAASLKDHGADLPAHALITLGSSGALYMHGGLLWYARPPRVSHVNPIGAGDSFAAGFIKAFLDRRPAVDALRFATAVAASDSFTPEPGLIVSDEIGGLYTQTSAEQW